ncbi:MAG: DnaT-like ssDNA-binding domain-containing protein, partial [Porticoccus sp.]|nr:DnaT-like ssDNA-binding domain-containing protein [Porticoccus sp.]
QFSWGSKFIKHVLRIWRNQQTQATKLGQQKPMSADWHPSQDAMDILVRQAGINHNFIEDAIPEFMLYWVERGEASNTWNSRFIMHVKRQWARFTATMEHDSEPRLIPQDWKPSEELFEVLILDNISRDFAERLAPEFVLYWRDSGQAHNSWNTKFLQQVKREWSRQQSATPQVISNGQQRPHRSNSTRNNNLIDELSDRSWAST